MQMFNCSYFIFALEAITVYISEMNTLSTNFCRYFTGYWCNSAGKFLLWTFTWRNWTRKRQEGGQVEHWGGQGGHWGGQGGGQGRHWGGQGGKNWTRRWIVRWTGGDQGTQRWQGDKEVDTGQWRKTSCQSAWTRCRHRWTAWEGVGSRR